jgi:hypothetical protein
MTNFSSSDLRDPQPPLPGEPERAKVAARAHELGRRRRFVQGGGALALAAAVAVSVAALTGGGGNGPGTTNRVEAASAGTDTSVSTPVSHVTTVPTTVAPAPAPDTTVAPAPANGTTPAPSSEVAPPPAVNEAPAVQPAAPATFTLSGTVTGNPADTTVSVTISGPGGSFDSSGTSFSVSGLPAGEYLVIAQWVDSTGTATAAVERVVAVNGDTSVTVSF